MFLLRFICQAHGPAANSYGRAAGREFRCAGGLDSARRQEYILRVSALHAGKSADLL